MDHQAYTDGGKVGLEFASHSTLEGIAGEGVRSWINAVREFRSHVGDEKWIAWEGDRFDFPVYGLACPLSLVSFSPHGPLSDDAKPHVVQVCKRIYGAFFAPLSSRNINDVELEQLKNPSFFKGMVDVICKYKSPAAKAE